MSLRTRALRSLGLRRAALTLGLAVWFQPATCFATTPAQAINDGGGDRLPATAADPADILVTANKRPERKQDVPMSVWALSAQQLERAQVRDFDDLVRAEPSLTITKTTQPGNNSINIRGVGTYAFSIATRSSVSVIVDDVPQAFQAQAFRELADVSAIEVLRGPQSTLFGTSATAGVIAITTASPTTTLSAGSRLGLTTDAEWRASAFVSGPLAPDVLFRISVSGNDYRGNLYNVYTRHWVNGQSGVDGRAKLVWNASDTFTITAAAHHDRSHSSCCTAAFQALSPGVRFGTFGGVRVPQSAILNGITPGADNRRISADIDPQGDATENGASLKAEWTRAGYTLTAISGLADYRLDDLQDTDGTAFDWGPDGANVAGAIAGGSANGGWFKVRATTQELRLTSLGTARLRFVAGLFHGQTRAQRSFVRGSNSLGQYGSLTSVPPTTSAYSSYVAQALDTNYALFANSTFDLAKRYAIVAGLRLNRDTISYRLTDRFAGVSYGVPGCSTVTPSGLRVSTCNTFDALSGRLALEYRPSPAVMIFAGYDRGYKGAAYDLTSTYTTRTLVTQPGPYKGYPIADVVAARQPVRPETVDALQFGWKSRIFDRLIWNVTLYTETFHDFQAQSRDELTRQNILNSIARVTTKGAEMEFAADLAPAFTLQAWGTYNDARIRIFPDAPCFSNQTAALGCIAGQQDLAGKRLPNAPRWKFSLSATHDERIADDLALTLIANWVWQSPIVESLLQDPNSVQPAYGLLGLGIDLHSARKSLRIYCSNLLDQSYALNRGRDGNWNINPYGAAAGPLSDATKWTPGRDSSRYVRAEFALRF